MAKTEVYDYDLAHNAQGESCFTNDEALRFQVTNLMCGLSADKKRHLSAYQKIYDWMQSEHDVVVVLDHIKQSELEKTFAMHYDCAQWLICKMNDLCQSASSLKCIIQFQLSLTSHTIEHDKKGPVTASKKAEKKRKHPHQKQPTADPANSYIWTPRSEINQIQIVDISTVQTDSPYLDVFSQSQQNQLRAQIYAYKELCRKRQLNRSIKDALEGRAVIRPLSNTSLLSHAHGNRKR